MSRITLATLEVPDVELFGHVYAILPVTKAVASKADQAEDAIDAAENADALVAAYGDVLDLRLRPTAEKQPKASAVIKKAWNANDLALPQLTQLVTDIANTDRPI